MAILVIIIIESLLVNNLMKFFRHRVARNNEQLLRVPSFHDKMSFVFDTLHSLDSRPAQLPSHGYTQQSTFQEILMDLLRMTS